MSQKDVLPTIQILKITCFCLLMGQAYQHFFFDPYYSMVSPEVVQNLMPFSGILFLLAGGLSLMASRKRMWIVPVLVLAMLNLCLLTWSSYERTDYVFAQLIEHTLQSVTPALLLLAVYVPHFKSFDLVCKVAIALTFSGHGLFAIGFYPVPPHFIEMFDATLGMSPNTALMGLYIAGTLDILASVLLFFPRFANYAAAYAVVWGFLTAFARLTSYVHMGPLFWITLHQNFFKFLVRVPHFMIPFTQLKQKIFSIQRERILFRIPVWK